MSFASGIVVEEGLGVDASPTPNSLAGIAEADQYFSARSNTDWSGATEAAKAASLVEATDYLEQEYRLRWKGMRVNTAQALSWPRYGVITEDAYEAGNNVGSGTYIGAPHEIEPTVVPPEVRAAVMELALRRIESTGTKLAADLDRGGDIKKVKAGSVEVEYGEWREPGKRYPVVEGLLKPFLNASAGSSRKLRRV